MDASIITKQQIGEEFESRFKTLPEDIKKSLVAVASVDTIFAIGKKHGLMVDQIGKMADEIWKVMLGLANPKDFIRNLAGAVGIESEKASAIASDVNAQIFQPVRESLRRIYDESRSMDQESAAPLSSLRPREAGEAIPRLKDGIAEPVPSNDSVSPIIYPHAKGFDAGVSPQDPRLPVGQGFEEPLRKEEEASSMEHESKEKEVKDERDEPEQLAPLVPSVLSRDQSGGEGELLYPEKMKEVSRETTKGREYQGKDPYRESIE